MSKIVKYSTIIFAIFLLTGCSCEKQEKENDNKEQEEIKVTDITIDTLDSENVFFEYYPSGEIGLSIKVGGEINLSVTISPENATNKYIKCYSSDTKIIEVLNYKLRAVGEGKANVYCENPDSKVKSNVIDIKVGGE